MSSDPLVGFVHELRAQRVVFAQGSVRSVPAEAASLGGRVLLIGGRHERAVVDGIAGELGNRLAGRIDDVAQHVPASVAGSATDHARRCAAEVLVCVGGGSATGLAKAVALQLELPILAVPTTYAGSEMTPIWGLSSGSGKTTGRNEHARPRTVVYDPGLTLSLPPGLTVTSAMNAAAHCIEALYVPAASPVSSMLAAEGLRCLVTSLPACVSSPTDLVGRTTAFYGAWLAGWALGSSQMGLHHKLAHVLGGRYNLPHSAVHSVLLPHVVAFNAPASPDAMAVAARALERASPSEVAPALFDLATGLGAPRSLRELGLAESTLDDVAREVTSSEVTNPRPLKAPALRAMLAAAYEGRSPDEGDT